MKKINKKNIQPTAACENTRTRVNTDTGTALSRLRGASNLGCNGSQALADLFKASTEPRTCNAAGLVQRDFAENNVLIVLGLGRREDGRAVEVECTLMMAIDARKEQS